MFQVLLAVLTFALSAMARTHGFDWTLSTQNLNPDGEAMRPVITINGQWPAPQIRVRKGDRVVITVHNKLEEDTSLHFHGIFQRNSSHMDGATMISQCPIPPGMSFTYDFEVADQTGTYWYHSHAVAQYGDGLRGALIIEDDEQEYDGDMALLLSDWYHTPTNVLVEGMFRQGSRGTEPRINSGLFNETEKQSIHVQPGKTYLLRLINVGMSATQYFYIEDHELVIVEIDGVKVRPVTAEAISLATGQRYGVLLKTKPSAERNYGMVQITNIMMHKKYTTNWLVYSDEEPTTDPMVKTRGVNDLQFVDDIDLKPLDSTPRLPEPNHRFEFSYGSDYFGQYGTKFYTMNSHPHLSPKVPTLHTVFSANSTRALDPNIYGEGTNAFVLQQGDIVEIVLNSNDHMRHPFHLHGHNFQVLSREAHEHYSPKLESELPSVPMIRDTVNVPGNGHVVLRFKADNPGAWFFHCHTEWHAVQGLGVVFIESPDLMVEQQNLPQANKDLCASGGYSPMGNAAGHEDLDDMSGEIKWPVPREQWVAETIAQSTTIDKSTTTAVPVSAVALVFEPIPSTTTTSTPTTQESISTPYAVVSSATPSEQTDVKDITMATKTQVLIIYILTMTAIAGLFALLIQRGMKRKNRPTLLNGDVSQIL